MKRASFQTPGVTPGIKPWRFLKMARYLALCFLLLLAASLPCAATHQKWGTVVAWSDERGMVIQYPDGYQEPLNANPEGGCPSIARNAPRMVYQSGQMQPNGEWIMTLVGMDLRNGKTKVLLAHNYRQNPSLSPDGTVMTFDDGQIIYQMAIGHNFKPSPVRTLIIPASLSFYAHDARWVDEDSVVYTLMRLPDWNAGETYVRSEIHLATLVNGRVAEDQVLKSNPDWSFSQADVSGQSITYVRTPVNSEFPEGDSQVCVSWLYNTGLGQEVSQGESPCWRAGSSTKLYYASRYHYGMETLLTVMYRDLTTNYEEALSPAFWANYPTSAFLTWRH